MEQIMFTWRNEENMTVGYDKNNLNIEYFDENICQEGQKPEQEHKSAVPRTSTPRQPHIFWALKSFDFFKLSNSEHWGVQFFNFLASLFSIFQILSMDKTFNFASFLSILWESKNFSLVKFSLFEKLLINSLYRACWSFLLFFFLFCFVDHSSVF